MRRIGRNFPDAAQAGVADGVVINQSRVTFSGQRGIVLVLWTVRMENAGAALIDRVATDFSGNLTGHLPFETFNDMNASATAEVKVLAGLIVQDPPAGSFIELVTDLSGGTVDIAALTCQLAVLSFAADVDEGPTVTVA